MLGHLWTGAADGLAKATQTAREMVMRYGMDEALCCVSHESHRGTALGLGEPFLALLPEPISEATQQNLDAAIADLLAHNLQRATRILQANHHVLERCSLQLLQLETQDTQALKQLTSALVQEST
jgi:cell division protease FtsH